MNRGATDLEKFRKCEQELHLVNTKIKLLELAMKAEDEKIESYALHNAGSKNAALKAFLILQRHDRLRETLDSELSHVEHITMSNTDAIPKLSNEELNHINKDQIDKFEKDMTPDNMGFEWDYNEMPVEIREEFSEEIKSKKAHHSKGQNSTTRTHGTTLTAEEELKILDNWANS